MTETKPKFGNRHNSIHHTKDGQTIWKSRSVAIVAHVVYIKNNVPYYLIGLRGETMDHGGKYNIPCGYLDWDEDMRSGMHREIWEEAGLDITMHDSIGFGKAINEIGAILYDRTYDNPWDINTKPGDDKIQNVTLHAGLVVKLWDDVPMPKLSLDNMEPGESMGAYWMTFEDVLAIDESEWAFNHYNRSRMFINHITSLKIV